MTFDPNLLPPGTEVAACRAKVRWITRDLGDYCYGLWYSPDEPKTGESGYFHVTRETGRLVSVMDSETASLLCTDLPKPGQCVRVYGSLTTIPVEQWPVGERT